MKQLWEFANVSPLCLSDLLVFASLPAAAGITLEQMQGHTLSHPACAVGPFSWLPHLSWMWPEPSVGLAEHLV